MRTVKRAGYKWLTSISVLITGFAIGMFAAQRRQALPESSPDIFRQRYEALASRIHALEEGELKEYVQLKKAEERYKKADEILGKILLALLVDAGIHIRPELANQLKELRIADRTTPAPELRQWQTEIARNPAPRVAAVDTPATARGWAKNEKSLGNVSSEEQARAFLDQVLIPDLYAEMRTVKPLDAGRLSQINGTFVGEIVFDDKIKPLWQLELSVAGAMDQDKAQGTLGLKVWENGQLISENSQNGVFHGYSSLGDDSAAILAEIEKDRGFMQLYTIPQSEKLIGNFYVKNGPGAYKRAGTVLLRRH